MCVCVCVECLWNGAAFLIRYHSMNGVWWRELDVILKATREFNLLSKWFYPLILCYCPHIQMSNLTNGFLACRPLIVDFGSLCTLFIFSFSQISDYGLCDTVIVFTFSLLLLCTKISHEYNEFEKMLSFGHHLNWKCAEIVKCLRVFQT